jgi:hypothetical protein
VAFRRLLGRSGATATTDGQQPTTDGREPTVGAEPRLPVDTSLVTETPRPAADGFDVLVTVAEAAYRTGAHLPLVEAARAAGARSVVVSAYDVHAGPQSTYPPVLGADDHVVARPTVAATWGGAVAAARPLLRSGVVVVQDAAILLPEDGILRLVAAVTRSDDPDQDRREAVVALPVVRSTDDVVASAGAVLVRGTAPVGSLLRGHPYEDAEALAGVRVFAGDEPCFAVRTDALAVPVVTVDTRTAVARLTRSARRTGSRSATGAPAGSAVGTPGARPRRASATPAASSDRSRQTASASAASVS